MAFLVSDIGGTNTRLALADGDGVNADTLMRARNDNYASFDDVLADYLSKHDAADVDGICVAIAGPVQGTMGRLTNRDWSLKAGSFGAQCGAARAAIINDLTALGFALSRNTPEYFFGAKDGPKNGQALVVGMGTGFNVSPTKRSLAGATVAMEAELGHAELPYSVAAIMRDDLGEAATEFQTFEDIFCGPGLEHLHTVISGKELGGADIMAAFEAQDTDAQRTVRLFARALGQLTRAMMHQYMPRDGIAFAGSASRGVLSSDALQEFISSLTADGPGIVDAASFPLGIITDDAAALEGCRQYLVQTS
ncbi:glucokinase [Shimia isoporae]|uniref:Glucokinase n=1 Tax=Shimia isoporae TaxID=647720 RepID=A0A4R1N8G3_9RHOB|nr:ROK family protein [Shimia isoporae]TCK98963.1 glucokinase [Shimia isoporae]